MPELFIYNIESHKASVFNWLTQGALNIPKNDNLIHFRGIKSFLSELFEKDLAVSIEEFNKIFNNQEFPKIINEVIIETLFQMGKKNFLTFKKFIKLIKKNNFKEASEEMIKSKWHEQTPKRARLLASLVEKKNE